MPSLTRTVAIIANGAAEAGPVSEPAGVEIIEVRADDGEQTPKVRVGPGRTVVDLDLRRFGFDERPDFETTFVRAGCLTIQVRVAVS